MDTKKKRVRKKPLNTQKYKLAGTGGGFFVCQQLSQYSFRVLLQIRDPSVGEGLGVTGGGFVENEEIFLNEKPGFITESAAEAYREGHEENLGFKNLFPLPLFLERVQSIASYHVRVNDPSGVHGTNFYALAVTDKEWAAAAQLPPGLERKGSLIEALCRIKLPLDRHNAEEGIVLSLPDGGPMPLPFYHKHELRALGQIAWHVQEGRLWQSR